MDDRSVYKEFEEFLMDFFVRKASGSLSDNDFDGKHSDSIRPLLEDILPTLSLPEIIRIKTYFNEVLSFHIKDTLGQETEISSQKIHASSSIIGSPNSDILSFKNSKLGEGDMQTGTRQESTPFEDFTQRGTAGMIQSTPLSISIAAGNQIRDRTDQEEYAHELEDPFINDIMSHINLSPIAQDLENQPILSNPNVNTSIQFDSSSIGNLDNQSHSFLRNFAHLVEGGKRKKLHHEERRCESHKQLSLAEQATPKPKRKRIPFKTLTNWLPKEASQVTEEFVLYFPLLPRKARNLIKRATGSDPKGKDQSSIPMEKIRNLSNVIRSHVSERHSSVELPAQSSFLSSPCTAQSLLRNSQLQPFTPVRGDGSGQLIGFETEQKNVQTRSKIRQQALVPIPERDSLMPRLTNTLLADVSFRDSLPGIIPATEITPEIPDNQLNIDQENMNLVATSENVGEINFQPQSPVQIGSPHIIQEFFEQHDTSVQVENLPSDNIPHPIENQTDDNRTNWFDILRPRLDVMYPNAAGEKRKRKTRKRRFEEDTPPQSNFRTQNAPVTLPMIPDDIGEQSTDYIATSNLSQLEHELRSYIKLIKENIKDSEGTWEHFDPLLFSENDDFEMYTHIFKRIIREDYVLMSTLYNEGTSRLDAARGFRLLLELQTIGLIEIFATGSRIERFKLIS